VPTQLIYTVRCPICGSVASLRIAHGLPNEKRPKIAMFDCPQAVQHRNPSDHRLLNLPKQLITTIPDYPAY
jgi:hypothetical protein